MNKSYFTIDFESTFVKIEILEHLAEIALENNKEKENIIKQIREITDLGMEGKIPLQESFSRRFKLLKAHKNHLNKVIELLKDNITPSFLRHKDFFKQYEKQIFIVTGSYAECVLPVTRMFGIKDKQVICNNLIYDKDGYITGVDLANPLSYKHGKAIKVAALGLTGTILVIGDGYTDYEIKSNGVADYFIAFTENVKRRTVVENADYVVKNFDECIPLFLERPPTLHHK